MSGKLPVPPKASGVGEDGSGFTGSTADFMAKEYAIQVPPLTYVTDDKLVTPDCITVGAPPFVSQVKAK